MFQNIIAPVIVHASPNSVISVPNVLPRQLLFISLNFSVKQQIHNDTINIPTAPNIPSTAKYVFSVMSKLPACKLTHESSL